MLFETCPPGGSETTMALVLGQMLGEIATQRELPKRQNAAALTAWEALQRKEAGEVDNILEVDLYFSAADELELAVIVSVSCNSTKRISIAMMSTRHVMSGKQQDIRGDFRGVVVFWDRAGERIEKVELWLGDDQSMHKYTLDWVEIKIEGTSTSIGSPGAAQGFAQNVSEIRAHLFEQAVVELSHEFVWSFDKNDSSDS